MKYAHFDLIPGRICYIAETKETKNVAFVSVSTRKFQHPVMQVLDSNKKLTWRAGMPNISIPQSSPCRLLPAMVIGYVLFHYY